MYLSTFTPNLLIGITRAKKKYIKGNTKLFMTKNLVPWNN